MSKNTQVTYVYRDASNYKTGAVVVLEGEMSPDQEQAIRATLNETGQFIPQQVGLEPLHDQFPSYYDDDIVWHELGDMSATEAGANGPTIAEFVASFSDPQWDESAAQEQLERWKRTVPRGPIG